MKEQIKERHKQQKKKRFQSFSFIFFSNFSFLFSHTTHGVTAVYGRIKAELRYVRVSLDQKGKTVLENWCVKSESERAEENQNKT